MLTVKQRHEMQQDIAIYNVMHDRKAGSFWNVRRAMAYHMRQARKLRDSELRRVAATLPA